MAFHTRNRKTQNVRRWRIREIKETKFLTSVLELENWQDG